MISSPRKPRLFTEEQFSLVQRLCAAPSPVGFEASMIDEVVIPEFESFMPSHWHFHRLTGTPGLIVDTAPRGYTNPLTVMVIGHADKIRLQVRSIGEDGKIYVNTQSFLPAAIIGHRFDLVIEDPNKPGEYRFLRNLTAQAFGAIHFADGDVRSGKKGVDPKQIYLETGLYGNNCKQQLEKLGVRPGQPAIFSRTVERGPTEGTFYGSYLDNALGCFSVIETARRIAQYEKKDGKLGAKNRLKNIRLLFTIATHEEIGLYGSTIAAGVHRPDVVIAADVNHDYAYAPGIGDRRMNRLAMGEGCTVSDGTVHHHPLVSVARSVARKNSIPVQRDFDGARAGNDSMAAALSAIDAASFSIGFPIRNMHTSSELAYDGDVLAGVDLLEALAHEFEDKKYTPETLKSMHTALSRNDRIGYIAPNLEEEE